MVEGEVGCVEKDSKQVYYVFFFSDDRGAACPGQPDRITDSDYNSAYQSDLDPESDMSEYSLN